MRGKIKVILCLLVIIFPLLGCWDRLEINDIAIVTGTSFDLLDDKQYKVAIQAPLPGEMGGAGSHGGGGGTSGGATYYLDAGIGHNVRQANEDLQKRMSRQLMFGHRRVSIIGEDLAKEGIRKILDVLTRTREARLRTQLFITEGNAIDILSSQPQLENLSAEAIREIGVAGYELTLRDFLLDYQKEGDDPLLPVLTLKENISPDPELVSNQVEISKMAIFKEDKLQFFTDEDQTSGIQWILGRKHGQSYTIEYDEGAHISFRIVEQTCDIKHSIKNRKPVYTFQIKLISNLLENETDLNLEETQVYDEINEKLKNKIVKEIEAIMDETLSKGIDTFGFGSLLHRKERKLWNDEFKESWREQLENIEYEININSKIVLTGLVTEGIGIGE